MNAWQAAYVAVSALLCILGAVMARYPIRMPYNRMEAHPAERREIK